MLQFLSFLAIFGFVLAGSYSWRALPQMDGRIIGGNDTTIDQHPHQVSLQSLLGSHFCGGSLVSADMVLTAAHCVVSKKPSNIQVRLGSTSRSKGGKVVAVKTVKYHEKYNRFTAENDVAIIQLATPVNESSSIRFIKMSRITPYSGMSAVVTGWGVLSQGGYNLPDALQEVKVNMVERKKCRSDSYKYGDQIGRTMVCAYATDKDACQGDSGGPLVAAGKILVGIVSWGYGCASPGYPGVYTDVPAMSDWIHDTIQKLHGQQNSTTF